MRRTYELVAGLVLGAMSAAAAQSFAIQYSYPAGAAALHLADLKFPSRAHGMACGYLEDGGATAAVTLATSDGGQHWSFKLLKDILGAGEIPLSLFFFSDSEGWIVTDHSLFFTADFGAKWRRIGDLPAGIQRVWFLTTDHGWAIGSNKRVVETKDGGQTWLPVAIAEETPGRTGTTTFAAVAFLRNHGVIAGWNQPAVRAPGGATAGKRYETPGTTIFLDTADGGRTWTSSYASMFGHATALAIARNATSLALFEFTSKFEYPSEVHVSSAAAGKVERAYRDARTWITDVALTLAGKPFLAGRSVIEGQREIAAPVRILTSEDFHEWTAIPCDDHATAHRVMLAIAEDRDVWAATDTGTLLKLVDPATK